MSAATDGIVSSASKMLSSLPAQFLALVLMNIVFIGILFWFLIKSDEQKTQLEVHEIDARERVITPLLKSCIDGLTHDQHGTN